MQKRKFGNSNLEVSVLGLGAGEIGNENISDSDVEKILNETLDNGITLIDTARGYGKSEERIGKFISNRRDEFVLSTKVGYGIEGYENWTYDIVIAGVDEALRKLKTDRIDIVHLHSCSRTVLENNGVIDALQKTVDEGKVLLPAYSGENEDLIYALETNKFRAIQTSVNITDQRDIEKALPRAKEKGMGTIAKRPAANAPWRFNSIPKGNYAEDYWIRWKQMKLDINMDWQEAALRFTIFTENIDSAIVGTANLNHLKQNIAAVEKGALPDEIYKKIRDAFKKNDDDWIGLL